ncbi:hypothetical protein NEMBOFW57_003281 [Staphylotrichum longicolle]|uniref:Uncharacterized protein n=1 Tax=Staphylotrichum longicolle TaxID=669026 RepID=A0AAD4I4G5_9PEZI|nr:hypothetical protein NEMBOFW57_003281 [Staphylotrichum longicolle]
MWEETGAPMYPSFSTPAYHSPQHVPSYQTPPPSQALIQSPPMVREPSRPPTPRPMGLLKQLPAEAVKNIRMMVGWEDCWNVCQANHWFRENFHPDLFTEEGKLLGLLDAERLYGRHGAEDSDMPSSRKSDGNEPPWLGCYHCYRRKPYEAFELFKWANSSSKNAHDADETKTRRYKSPSQKQGHPYSPASTSSERTPPPANPHYDPSLTRSGLTAAAASRGHRTSPDAADNCSNISPRIKETWGVRRFCVECGLDKGYYNPGDLIDVQRPKEAKLARWVCRCRRLHERPRDTKCSGCGDIVPLSCPRRM